METTVRASGRHFGMDWLRVSAFGLLIFYHIGMYFVPWDWHVKSAEPLEWATFPMLALNPWRLPLLFAVSGYASYALLRKLGGPGAFMRSRSSRLLVPLVFAIIVIVPPQPWIELMFKHGYGHGFLHFWSADYFRFGTLDGIVLPTWQHLWFVVYLWAYTMVLGLSILILPAGIRSAIGPAINRALGGINILVLPILAFGFINLVVFPDGDETHALVDDWSAHAIYFPVFLFGFLLRDAAHIWAAVERWWKVAAAMAVVAYAAVVAIDLGWLGDGESAGIAREVARLLQGWGAIVALLGIADRFGNVDHKSRVMLTEAVYPFYIIHQTIIVVVGWWLLGFSISPAIEFLVLFAATVAGCWLFYDIGRRIPGVRILIGLKGALPPQRTPLADIQS